MISKLNRVLQSEALFIVIVVTDIVLMFYELFSGNYREAMIFCLLALVFTQQRELSGQDN